VSKDTCKKRVMSRSGHRTLPPASASLGIVDRFAADLQPPSLAEGFGRVVVLNEGDHVSLARHVLA
jgi:hypothetical protein